ncbi:MAG: hypothetical protein ABL999_06930 [Pyrinomonadaceae bacterium]
MTTRQDWLPYSLNEKHALFVNVRSKIDGYEAVLPLTSAQTARIKEICDIFIYANGIVEQSKATMKALVSWRNLILSNERSSTPLPPRPMFDNTLPPSGASAGIYAEFRALMEIVKSAPGFTTAIGTNLTIMSPKRVERSLAEVAPQPNITSIGTNSVRIVGSLHGMDAMRVEYMRKGEETWRFVAFLTRLPATVAIQPAVEGEPESGIIRCILMKNNQDAGQYSPSTRVTISED